MTQDQLNALVDRACRGVALQPAEGAALRAAIAGLQHQAAVRAAAANVQAVMEQYVAGKYREQAAAQEAAIEAYLADGGFTVTRTAPVEQLAAEYDTLQHLGAALTRVAARDALSIGQIGQLTGVPMVVDDSLSPGEVHLRPLPRPREGGSGHVAAQPAGQAADVRPPHWTDPLHPRIAVPLAGTTLPTEPGSAIDCPACRRRADIPQPWPGPGHPDGRLTPDEIAALLHAYELHPGWEYATTTGPRKAWENADVPPYGDDGEPDHSWEPNLPAGSSRGWERFDYHEEAYWRRPSRPDNATAPGQN